MWVRLQECRGPLGERLKRTEWGQALTGELLIRIDKERGYVATVHVPDIGPVPERQVLFPLFDVRVQTFGRGFVVTGYRIQTEGVGAVIREVRQAWYCLPA
jgi:hypothetical protein